MSDRTSKLIKRIQEDLNNQGLVEKPVYGKMDFGIGNHRSFFDMMLHERLNGRENLSIQEVWEEMKMQMNYLEGNLAKASEEYRKLQNKYRHLEQDYNDLLKGRDKN